MFKLLNSLKKRWKQYKYRFVPWIAFNIRKRKLRAVESDSTDKVTPDSKVEHSLLIFFTGLSKQNGSADQMHDPKGQRSGGQVGENIATKSHVHWCQSLNTTGHHISGHTLTSKTSCDEILSFWLQKGKWLVIGHQEDVANCLHVRMKFPDHIFNLPNLESPVFALKQNTRTSASWTESTRSYATVPSQNHTNHVQTLEGSRLSCDGLGVMHKLLGFAIERRPSSIAGGGTGVFVSHGTIPTETVVAMYPGTVYKPWEPILLQSLANPFIFRCLDGTLIDGNDKGLSRMVYRSCTQRDRMGPYLTSDLSWLTNSLTNPMAVGQYVNNQNKGNPANVAYQEFDVPESFPLHLLHYIPNVFYSSTYQQSDPSSKRMMRTVVLVSLREIECGEELFSSYFTIVH